MSAVCFMASTPLSASNDAVVNALVSAGHSVFLTGSNDTTATLNTYTTNSCEMFVCPTFSHVTDWSAFKTFMISGSTPFVAMDNNFVEGVGQVTGFGYASDDDVDFLSTGHPVAGSFDGVANVVLLSTASYVVYYSGYGEMTRLATFSGTDPVIGVWESGALWADGTPSPARGAHLLVDTAFANANYLDLLTRMVSWVADAGDEDEDTIVESIASVAPSPVSAAQVAPLVAVDLVSLAPSPVSTVQVIPIATATIVSAAPAPTTAAQVAPLVAVEIASLAPAPVTHIQSGLSANHLTISSLAPSPVSTVQVIPIATATIVSTAPTPTTAAQVAPLVAVEIASFAPAPVTHIDDDMRALEPAPPHWIIDVPADHWTIDVPRDHWSF